MNTRLPETLEAALDELEGMLPVWLEKLRVRAAFDPQFDALAQRILVKARTDDERRCVQRRLDAMLARQGIVRRP
ncbi:hypothetical protein MNO14_05105 [Luteimonas sp. S4-F44]|uniref:hypothetical protein n=1 Tax=Luteimonas sp. S4-F44 TaxID=2925842 RepID=UPI001F533B26|nr:hypothetical protein [Luteimonas sp. S4-F44]UNK43463.1 hypothetical protein MNO14_05105 [Luteimonas sp. S4-F44]